MIENKCLYPNENVPHQPYNEMLSSHVPQCLSEMVAYNAEELWLIRYTLYAVSIIRVQFDEHLWNKIMVIVEDVYGEEKVRSPSHLHPLIKELKKAIQTFCSTHCKLLIELASFHGQITAPSAPGLHSMYYSTPTLETSEINVNSIHENLLTAGVECKLLIHEIHKVLHRLAKEVLVLMISTKDRFQHGNIPNAMPLAYALKGNSISTKEVQDLVKIMKDKLAENGIPVLVYCCDGQWKNLVFFDDDGEPLTRLQLNIKTWNKISKMSIDQCFQDFSTIAGVCQANKYMLS